MDVSITITTEYCIVGSGPGGAVLAEKLAMAGKQVVVLEQGGAYGPKERAELVAKKTRTLVHGLTTDFDTDWPEDYKNAPLVSAGEESYYYGHVSGTGGTSLHWMGTTPRPRVDDLRVRSLFGYGRDWPVSYEELEPWLLRAEHELGVSGNQDNPYASPRSGGFPMPGHEFSPFERDVFAPAAARLGWTAHSCPCAVNSVARDGRPACLKCRMCWHCPSAAKYSAERSHLARFLAQGSGRLITGAKLLRLETSPDGRTIAFAHARQIKDNAELIVKASTYILAMNAVETPRMLMLSAGDKYHRHGLGNAGGQLGKGFSDHLIALFWIILKDPVEFSRGFPSMMTDHYRAHAHRDKHGSFYMFMYPGPAGEWTPSSLFTSQAIASDRLSLQRLRSSVARSVSGIAMVEVEGSYTMTLDPTEKDGFGNPRPRIQATLTPWEREGMVQATRAGVQLAEAMGAAHVEESWSKNEKWWAAHPGGATAMGETPEQGVCDRNLRVFGLDNLYLTSSSVFPHQGANNPTLTICALSLRLAAHLGAA